MYLSWPHPWYWAQERPRDGGEPARLTMPPSISYEDPLAVFERHREAIEICLRACSNHVGKGIVVGQHVVMWGGKHPNGVGLVINDGVRIYDQCRLVLDQVSSKSGIMLGERVAINFGCFVDGSGGVDIGPGTIVGPNTMIVSSQHVVSDVPVQQSGKTFARVTIGRDVWIGGNVSIMAGIEIGDRAVVAAGSVVTRNVAADTIVAGNPAKLLREK